METSKSNPLSELFSDLESELQRLGYAESTIQYYRDVWKKLKDYATKRGETHFTEELGANFLKDEFKIDVDDFGADLKRSQVQRIRVIRMLGDFQLHHAVLRRYYRHHNLLEGSSFQEVHQEFTDWCAGRGYSRVTRGHYTKQSAEFLDFSAAQEITNVSRITGELVRAYIRTLSGYTSKTVEQRCCSLRALFRFLLEKELVAEDLTQSVPSVNTRKQNKIPSVWTHEELEKLISAIDRGNPAGKRDYAMILLACCLGIRSVDLKNLRFKNFDWNANMLRFTQSKTGQETELPLTPEVGWAVIDYLKNGRPQCESDFVFVRHTAPHLPFTADNHLYDTVKRYMRIAQISKAEKKRGMHSLRHTLASFLLEKETPLPVISDVLGHVSTDSTAVYLKIDLPMLCECPLNHEEVNRVD